MTETGSTPGNKKPARVKLYNVRLNYVYLAEPDRSDAKKSPKYRCEILINSKQATLLAELKAAALAAKKKAQRPEGERYAHKAIRSGDEIEKPEYRGCMFIRAKSEDQPKLALADGSVTTDIPTIKREFYSGMIADVIVEAWFYGSKPGSTNKGIGWILQVVRKVRDGKRLDNRADVSDLGPVREDELDIWGDAVAKSAPLREFDDESDDDEI